MSVPRYEVSISVKPSKVGFYVCWSEYDLLNKKYTESQIKLKRIAIELQRSIKKGGDVCQFKKLLALLN